MSVPKPPFYSVTDELLFEIYSKISGNMGALKAEDINTIAKLNAILGDADLVSVELLLNTINGVKGNVPSSGNTLEKLYNIIQGLNYLTREDIDTLEEINNILSDADLIRTADINGILQQYITYRKQIQFYFRSRGSSDDDCHDQDRFLLRGKIDSISECLSSDLTNVTYKTRLDTSISWMSHSNLSALQAWVNAHIEGTAINGTLFWIKCIPIYKQGKTGEAGNLFSYQSPTI